MAERAGKQGRHRVAERGQAEDDLRIEARGPLGEPGDQPVEHAERRPGWRSARPRHWRRDRAAAAAARFRRASAPHSSRARRRARARRARIPAILHGRNGVAFPLHRSKHGSIPPACLPRESGMDGFGANDQGVVALRRALHAHPELGFLEYRTAALAADRLEKLGFAVKAGPEVMRAGAMMGVPSPAAIEAAQRDALAAGAPPPGSSACRAGRPASSPSCAAAKAPCSPSASTWTRCRCPKPRAARTAPIATATARPARA